MRQETNSLYTPAARAKRLLSGPNSKEEKNESYSRAKTVSESQPITQAHARDLTIGADIRLYYKIWRSRALV